MACRTARALSDGLAHSHEHDIAYILGSRGIGSALMVVVVVAGALVIRRCRPGALEARVAAPPPRTIFLAKRIKLHEYLVAAERLRTMPIIFPVAQNFDTPACISPES